jgi:2,3-bisphosphoglycerate-dependent phosphoglycerate mutase
VTIFLVRHAEPVAPGDPRFQENERPLTGAGRRQAELLAEELAGQSVTAVYSSPYPRAVQTVEPLARRLELEVRLIDDLRERCLSPDPLPDWRDHLRQAWIDFSYRLSGGESSATARARISRVLGELRVQHVGEAIVVASHGNLIALGLYEIAPDQVDFAFWNGMPMPAVYRLEAGAVSGPGLDPGGTTGGRSGG